MSRWTLTPSERFWSKVDKSGECWLWTAYVLPNGYGWTWGLHGKTDYAHRVAYELEHGAIPEGFQVHHTCENTLCMRPDHLLALSPREHIVGQHENTPTGENARKTHCKYGHALYGANLRLVKHGRRCRECERRRDRERRRKRRQTRTEGASCAGYPNPMVTVRW